MPLTYTTANNYLNHLVRGEYLSSNSPYIGLSTTPPNREGGNVTEPPSSSGYARVRLGSSQINKASVGFIQNSDVIYFPEATASWGTCTHYVIYTAQTEGTLLAYGPLDDAIAPEIGKISIIPLQGLRFSLG